MKRLLRVLLAMGGLFVLFLVVKESREPFLWLFVDDLLRPKPAPLTVPLVEHLALRLYADTRPHTGKVARLQKGLVLVVEGREQVEEGFGFGLPLVEVDGRAYLSRSARVEQMGSTLLKHYQLDTLDTPSGFLRGKYEPVSPIGSVTVRYTPTSDGRIDVAVDFSELLTEWDRAYLMNEQGARFFTAYEEEGDIREGQELGRWQPSVTERGCMLAQDRSVRFCVQTADQTSRYYGRERYRQYYWIGVYSLSWAGIDLEVVAPADSLEYHILVDSPAYD